MSPVMQTGDLLDHTCPVSFETWLYSIWTQNSPFHKLVLWVTVRIPFCLISTDIRVDMSEGRRGNLVCGHLRVQTDILLFWLLLGLNQSNALSVFGPTSWYSFLLVCAMVLWHVPFKRDWLSQVELTGGKGGRAFLKEPCAWPKGEDSREQGGVGIMWELVKVGSSMALHRAAQGRHMAKLQRGWAENQTTECSWWSVPALLHETVQHCFPWNISRCYAC